MKLTRVNLSVTTEDADVMARATEAMARAGAGLAMEGVPVFIMINEEEEDQ